MSSKEVKKVIKSLYKKKSAISSCDSVDTYLLIFTDIINSTIRNGTFPKELKLAEVTPLLKNPDPFDKANCRPVRLLSHVLKVYGKIIFYQISIYFELYFSKLLTGFRKGIKVNLLVLSLWIFPKPLIP